MEVVVVSHSNRACAGLVKALSERGATVRYTLNARERLALNHGGNDIAVVVYYIQNNDDVSQALSLVKQYWLVLYFKNPVLPDTVAEMYKRGVDRCFAPTELPELQAAQIMQLLWRSDNNLPQLSRTIVAGDLVVDLNTKRVMCAGKPVYLTPNEFAIVAYLAQHYGSACRYDQIAARFYEYFDPDSPADKASAYWTVKTHASRIRRKGISLVSVRNYGLRLGDTAPAKT